MRRFCPHMRFGVTVVAVFNIRSGARVALKNELSPICVPKPGLRQRPQRAFRRWCTVDSPGIGSDPHKHRKSSDRLVRLSGRSALPASSPPG